MNSDKLVDLFVEKVNQGRHDPKREGEVPAALRTMHVEEGWYDWCVKLSNRVSWIADLESKLTCRLPRTFYSLVSRYEYPAFEAGPVVLLANTFEGTEYEFRTEIFRDGVLSVFLLKNGFIPFAKPSDRQYDPVCFDARRPAHRREFPIVRIDHEQILCNDRLRVVEQLAASFQQLVSEFVSERRLCP
ncbi:MAG: SMI1/KNR4 family protein [Armatimonadetes bacterium]|nr:SMI1/KNR4 family protein [Armatimonadota bacterium]